jgi:hypothetical protein
LQQFCFHCLPLFSTRLAVFLGNTLENSGKQNPKMGFKSPTDQRRNLEGNNRPHLQYFIDLHIDQRSILTKHSALRIALKGPVKEAPPSAHILRTKNEYELAEAIAGLTEYRHDLIRPHDIAVHAKRDFPLPERVEIQKIRAECLTVRWMSDVPPTCCLASEHQNDASRGRTRRRAQRF